MQCELMLIVNGYWVKYYSIVWTVHRLRLTAIIRPISLVSFTPFYPWMASSVMESNDGLEPHGAATEILFLPYFVDLGFWFFVFSSSWVLAP